MKIQKIVSQHRRDFTAIYECDHDDCDHSGGGQGYDDENFHNNVIPKMKCPKCGRISKKETPIATPKYAPWEVV